MHTLFGEKRVSTGTGVNKAHSRVKRKGSRHGGLKKQVRGLKKKVPGKGGSEKKVRGLNKKGRGLEKRVWGLKKKGRLEKKGLGVKKKGSPNNYPRRIPSFDSWMRTGGYSCHLIWHRRSPWHQAATCRNSHSHERNTGDFPLPRLSTS